MTDGKDHPKPVNRVPAAWEHGDMGTVTFRGLSDYSNHGADIAALGLKNGNGISLQVKAMDARGIKEE